MKNEMVVKFLVLFTIFSLVLLPTGHAYTLKAESTAAMMDSSSGGGMTLQSGPIVTLMDYDTPITSVTATIDATGHVNVGGDPVRSGLGFWGWYQDKYLRVPFDFTDAYEEDVTLYAKWFFDAGSVPHSPTVAFYYNGRLVATPSSENPAVFPVSEEGTNSIVAFMTGEGTPVDPISGLDGDYDNLAVILEFETSPLVDEGQAYSGQVTFVSKDSNGEDKVVPHVSHEYVAGTSVVYIIPRPTADMVVDYIYAPVHTHTMVMTEAVAPTCTESGTQAYWTCASCGKLYADADGLHEIEAPVSVAALGHLFGAGVVTTSPTCTHDGVRTYTCSRDPSHTYTVPINHLAHSIYQVARVEPTYDADGHEAYYECSICKQKFSDAAATHVIEAPTIIPKLQRSEGDNQGGGDNSNGSGDSGNDGGAGDDNGGSSGTPADSDEDDGGGTGGSSGGDSGDLDDPGGSDDSGDPSGDSSGGDDSSGGSGDNTGGTGGDDSDGKSGNTGTADPIDPDDPSNIISPDPGNSTTPVNIDTPPAVEPGESPDAPSPATPSSPTTPTNAGTPTADAIRGSLSGYASGYAPIEEEEENPESPTEPLDGAPSGNGTAATPTSISSTGFPTSSAMGGIDPGNVAPGTNTSASPQVVSVKPSTDGILEIDSITGTAISPAKVQISTEAAAIALSSKLKVTFTGSRVVVTWGAVKGAEFYEVYVTYCGTEYPTSPTIRVAAGTTSVVIKKLNGAKLDQTRNFKLFVSAYRMNGHKRVRLGRSITAHFAGGKAKATNARAIKLSSSAELTLRTGATSTVQAVPLPVDPKKPLLSEAHAATLRFASSDKSVAVVSGDGVITAISPGTCTIYLYAANGYAKKVKVTVTQAKRAKLLAPTGPSKATVEPTLIVAPAEPSKATAAPTLIATPANSAKTTLVPTLIVAPIVSGPERITPSAKTIIPDGVIKLSGGYDPLGLASTA